MSTFVLTDVSSEVWLDSFSVDATAMGLGDGYSWSVKKHRLRGGRRDGVDLIVDNGCAEQFTIIPMRGMGLWKGWYEGDRLGWDSPVTDGPVHPSLVNLAATAGLGWLDGFDELLARCGLENNGAPFSPPPPRTTSRTVSTARSPTFPRPLWPFTSTNEPPHEIVVEGHVAELRLFGPQVQMKTRIATVPGSNPVRRSR